MEVCIIGGGFSGISSCIRALKNGFLPFVLEKNDSVGGVWRGDDRQVGIWKSLHTNSSKQMMWFSDFPWSEEDEEYPLGSSVLGYLESYVKKRNLTEFFSFRTAVKKVTRVGSEYLVRWEKDNEVFEKVFKYVIVATGKYSSFHNPIKGQEVFSGTVVLGGNYREGDLFSGKKVVCIGKSFTASDIALEASRYTNDVTQIFKRPSLMMNRYICGIPFEYNYYLISNLESPAFPVSTLEKNIETCQTVIAINGNPAEVSENMGLDESYYRSHFVPFLIVSDEYINSVKSGKIKTVRGKAEEFYENGLILEDGRRVECDVVVIGCGYLTDYSFLDDEIKSIIKYDKDDQLLPTILYRSIFHPDLPGLAFVGNFVYGAPCKFELQAEVAFRFFQGTLSLGFEEINKGLEEEASIRTQSELKMPYHYFDYFKDMLRILGMKIDTEFIQSELDWKGLILPSFLFLNNTEMKEISLRVIEEIKRKYPGYRFN